MGVPAESASGPKPTVPTRPGVIAIAISADLTTDLTGVCIEIDRAGLAASRADASASGNPNMRSLSPASRCAETRSGAALSARDTQIHDSHGIAELSARSISVRRCPRPVRSARNSAGAANELDHLTGIRTRWSSRLRRMTMTYADKQRPRRCLVSWIECHQQRRAVRRRRRAPPLPTSVAMHFGKRRQERQRRRRESICRSRGQGR